MMQISIQARGFSLTDALRDHVHKRVRFALARASDRVRRVDVRLSDINGTRGGVDKRCLVDVRLDGATNVLVEDTQSDLYTAIDRASGRAGRTLMRRLTLETSRRRRDAPRQAPQERQDLW